MCTFKLETQIQNIILTNALPREQQNRTGVTKETKIKWERVYALITALHRWGREAYCRCSQAIPLLREE